MRHRAAGIELGRHGEALDRLGMVEAEQPVQAAVEPDLRVGRRRGDFAAVRSEIKIGHAHLSSSP